MPTEMFELIYYNINEQIIVIKIDKINPKEHYNAASTLTMIKNVRYKT